MTGENFQGLRVLALESRRAREVAKLIENNGGKPLVVPAMREIPLESNHEALAFAAGLIAGNFDLVLFLTGAGARILFDSIFTGYEREVFLSALRSTKIAVRGPKPQSVLREYDILPSIVSAEPSTWREVLESLDKAFGPDIKGLRIAIQEYGATSAPLLDGLAERGATVTCVPVYQWALPEDLTELKQTIHTILRKEVDVVLFLTGVQAAHLMEVAREMNVAEDLRQALRSRVVISVGPSTTEELQLQGIPPDFQPSHPKMGIMIGEAGEVSAKLLAAKRQS
jgi:uroporphyrinogen-III synthase